MTNSKFILNLVAVLVALISPTFIYGKKIIHLCPHSHDDVGWLKTYNEYYDGSAKDVDFAPKWTSVANTIEVIVNSLLQNPSRRFVQIEMKFFSMWFYELNEERKKQVRSLVKSGQLEIANAGWSMHDEACPSYEDMINNHMLGHQFVLKEFGVKPRIGWQIDPFGHSNTNARLFADMGFDAWFFGRMDWVDEENRAQNQQLEWVWMPNGDQSKKIFTHKMWQSYIWMPIPYFDIKANNKPFITDQKSPSYSADYLADMFIKNMTDKIAAYRSDHIFQPWGDDFGYMDGYRDFTNIDKMIDYINEKYADDFEVRYSTPSEYIDAIAKENITWPTKYDDLFPYSDHNGNQDIKSDFWTGYFTSKPNLKGYIQQASSFTHAASALFTERMLASDSSSTEIRQNLISNYALLDAMGITQHHDAITGTAKEVVTKDYASILYKAIDYSLGQYAKIIADKIKDQTGHQVKDNKWTQCKQTNLTYLDCPVALAADLTNDTFSMAVAVHNPSSLQKHFFNILVPRGQYKVEQFSQGEFSEVNSNLLCHLDLDDNLEQVDSCSLEVKKITLAPKEINLFKVTRLSKEFSQTVEQKDFITIPDSQTIIKIAKMDTQKRGIIRLNILNEFSGLNETVEFALKYWEGRANFNKWSKFFPQNSGAYIFIPADGQYEALEYSEYISQIMVDNNTFITTFGKLDDENKMSEQVNVTLKVLPTHDQNKFLFKVDVDMFGLPNKPYGGHEVVVEFSNPALDNKQTFYTDANGLEMQKRIVNYRPTWNVSDNYDGSNVNITANFYPVTSAIYIKDELKQKTLTVMNDRSQAGTSLENGKIQLMQNRRLFADDARGVDEALNQQDNKLRGIRVKATYHVELSLNGAKSSQRDIQPMIEEPVQIFYGFGLLKVMEKTYESNLKNELREAATSNNVKLLTFPTARNKFIMRLENLNDMNESALVDVQAIANAFWNEANLKFESQNVTINIEELSISANMPISEMQERKIKWKTVDDEAHDLSQAIEHDDSSSNIKTLKAMQIRVFQVQITPQYEYNEIDTGHTDQIDQKAQDFILL